MREERKGRREGGREGGRGRTGAVVPAGDVFDGAVGGAHGLLRGRRERGREGGRG